MFLLLLLPCLVLGGEDYYKLLGITKNADNREIRKAFKKLALTLHPDKNDAEDAHEKFLKINRAYEVLKDEEKRKKYDMFGDEDSGGSSSRGSSYQSWQYYHSDFGLYDEDDSIVTLDYREFQQTVLQGHSLWFINYYSPRCGHCHDLAPEWRSLARHLEGTGVRVGAVNCQEEPSLCRSQGVTGYPSLLLYTQDQGTKKFQGRREQEELLDYLLQHMEDRAVTLWTGNFKQWSGRESGAWLVLLCEDRQEGCTSLAARSLAAASLEGLARVGVVECREDRQLCDSLQGEGREGSRALYFPKGLGEEGRQGGMELEAAMDDHKEISAEVLAHLPELILLDGLAFQEMRRRLDQEVGPACLVQFLHGLDGQSQEYKKLLPQLPRVRVARVDCSSSHPICDDLHISRFPTFVMFKVGGAMEVHYGKPSLQEVGQFGRLSSQARTMETLAAEDFPQILSAGGGVFIDFFAPWCPPCMSLLPEFRKASTFIGGQITFGTVDCTVHGRVCQQHGIRAYPTTVFFNGTKPHKYSGGHRARELADFVEDTLRPAVVELTGSSFHQLVGAKTEEEVWMVDFFAPWCGPCQQLAPEWRQLAKLTLHNPRVHVAKVDCTVEQGLCSQQGVDSYPTVRLYPRGSLGSSRYQPDTRHRRDSASLHSWLLEQLPSSVENITPYLFQHGVLSSKQLWLVEFYTPWCGHCTHFAPQYDQVGLALQGKAKVGKINCEKYKQLCKQAEVTSYPTLRIYRGAHSATDFEEVKERDVPGILARVEGKLEEKKKERGGHDEL